jgi:hypothetical protein
MWWNELWQCYWTLSRCCPFPYLLFSIQWELTFNAKLYIITYYRQNTFMSIMVSFIGPYIYISHNPHKVLLSLIHQGITIANVQ